MKQFFTFVWPQGGFVTDLRTVVLECVKGQGKGTKRLTLIEGGWYLKYMLRDFIS